MPAAVFEIVQRRLNSRALRRGFVAGTAWGAAVSGGLIALEAMRCEAICLDAAAFTVFLSSVAGLATIGPLAAFGRPA